MTRHVDVRRPRRLASYLEKERDRNLASAHTFDTTGLAISGGGVRSASFALGALQTLGRLGLLSRFGFVSTVSGGGLTAAAVLTAEPPTPSSTRLNAAIDEPELIARLRRHASYLAPGRGIGATTLGDAIGDYVVGAAINGLWLFCVLGLLVAAIGWWVLEASRLYEPGWACGCVLVIGVGTAGAIPSILRVRPSAHGGFDFRHGSTVLLLASLVVSSTVAVGLRSPVTPVSELPSYSLEYALLRSRTILPEITETVHRYLCKTPGPAHQQHVFDVAIVTFGLAFLLAFLWRALSVARPSDDSGDARSDARELRRRASANGVLGLLVLAGMIALHSLSLGHLSSSDWSFAGVLSRISTLTALGGSTVTAAGAWVAVNALLQATTNVGVRTPRLLIATVACLAALGAAVLLHLRLAGLWSMDDSSEFVAHGIACLVALGVLYLWFHNPRLRVWGSLHHLYRDRLRAAFLHPALKAEPKVADLPASPTWIINTTINLPTEDSSSLAGHRRADLFEMTSLHVGSDTTGYVDASEWEGGGWTVPKAIAVSAAAVAPRMGVYSARTIFVMAGALNLRLGSFGRNPAHADWYQQPGINDGRLFAWWTERLGANPNPPEPPRPSAIAPHVYLSDGGHYENLGLLALIRRRCRVIVVLDAEADPERTFGGLADAVRLARVEEGVEIDIDLEGLRPNADGVARQPCAIGRIRYAGARDREVKVAAGLAASGPLRATARQTLKSAAFQLQTHARRAGADEIVQIAEAADGALADLEAAGQVVVAVARGAAVAARSPDQATSKFESLIGEARTQLDTLEQRRWLHPLEAAATALDRFEATPRPLSPRVLRERLTEFVRAADAAVDLIRNELEAVTQLEWTALVSKDESANGYSGILLYIKSNRLSTQPADVLHYGLTNALFPHEPTSNQFFQAEQFEAYRKLGEVVTRRALAPIAADLSGASRLTEEQLISMLDRLGHAWAIRGAEDLELFDQFAQRYVEQEREWAVFLGTLGDAVETVNLDAIDVNSKYRHALEHHWRARVQFMEQVFFGLRLWTALEDPWHQGWIRMFRSYVATAAFRDVWERHQATFSPEFGVFVEWLNKDPVEPAGNTRRM